MADTLSTFVPDRLHTPLVTPLVIAPLAAKYQATLAQTVQCAGIGLHSGCAVNLRLLPAPPNTGIVFRRVDLHNFEIPAVVDYVAHVSYATTLMRMGVMVATVEHLLSALVSAEIDNCFVELDSLEVPILDGSAGQFMALLAQAGKVWQPATRQYLRVLKPVTITNGDRWMRIEPSDNFIVEAEIAFDHPLIGTQKYCYIANPAKVAPQATENNATVVAIATASNYATANAYAMGNSYATAERDTGKVPTEGQRDGTARKVSRTTSNKVAQGTASAANFLENNYLTNNYLATIAPARTFGFEREIPALRQAGLTRGGSLDNAIVLSDTGLLNPEGLRFSDEFVRHKILDIIGDLALAGYPILGKVTAVKSGHAVHAQLVAQLVKESKAWELVTR